MFDESRAQRYKKTELVLAFEVDSPVRFDKSWGVSAAGPGGWIVIRCRDGSATTDAYCLDASTFEATYEVASIPNSFAKKAAVEAYELRPDEKFAGTKASPGDWVVRNPGEPPYIVQPDVFARAYVLA